VNDLKFELWQKKIIKLFLRLALAAGFLSASADRLGWWPQDVSAWGNWNSFLEYTEIINPWIPISLIPTVAIVATVAEVVFALCLLLGFKTEFFAKLSGILLMLFALSMTFSTGVKGVFDYSVFSAAAAAFALSLMKEKYLELDSLFHKKAV
jgi:uncharacterized membrane protein YphA (DoxX/SURF4 family)